MKPGKVYALARFQHTSEENEVDHALIDNNPAAFHYRIAFATLYTREPLSYLRPGPSGETRWETRFANIVGAAVAKKLSGGNQPCL